MDTIVSCMNLHPFRTLIVIGLKYHPLKHLLKTSLSTRYDYFMYSSAQWWISSTRVWNIWFNIRSVSYSNIWIRMRYIQSLCVSCDSKMSEATCDNLFSTSWMTYMNQCDSYILSSTGCKAWACHAPLEIYTRSIHSCVLLWLNTWNLLCTAINTLRPRQNSRDCSDDIFKFILFND